MSAEASKRRLGRGLSALLGEPAEDDSTARPSGPRPPTATVPVEWLTPSPFQPRRRFDEAEMEALVGSIRERGMLQPILVRPKEGVPDAYEIVAGERRWRAAQKAQLHTVPVIVKDLNDRDTLEIALIENLQRENLTPLEEAEAYSRLMQEFAHPHEALGQSVGRSRSHVANMLRLLELPAEIKGWVDAGELSAGHARALLGTPDAVAIARQVMRAGLNVRQTEKLCQKHKKPSAPRKPKDAGKDTDTLALERDLSALLGLKVSIDFQGTGGSLAIRFDHLEQLDDILQRLSAGASVAGGSGPRGGDDDGSAEMLPDGDEGPPATSMRRGVNFLEIPAFLRDRGR